MCHIDDLHRLLAREILFFEESCPGARTLYLISLSAILQEGSRNGVRGLKVNNNGLGIIVAQPDFFQRAGQWQFFSTTEESTTSKSEWDDERSRAVYAQPPRDRQCSAKATIMSSLACKTVFQVATSFLIRLK